MSNNQSAGVWVKASERLPEKMGYYFTFGHHDRSYPQVTFWYANKKEWSSTTFEWLDESAANNGIDGDDFYGVKIFKNDRVNSVLNAAIRFLDDEQMIALRDCLIKRTPANNGIGDEKDKEIERLICLIEQRERSTHYTFYANTTTMTSTEIEEQFKERWEQFKKENNL